MNNTRDFIAGWEKLARVGLDSLVYPYLDAVGLPTQGYGHRVDSMDAAPWSEDQALSTLQDDIDNIQTQIVNLSPGLSGYRLTAIVSFAFNCGVSAYANSHLRMHVDKGEWYAASLEIQKWNHAGGQVFAGLTKRRQAEAALLWPIQADDTNPPAGGGPGEGDGGHP